MHPPEDRQGGGTAFDELAQRFGERVAAVRSRVDARYVRPDWARRNAELERDLLPVPPQDFLRHPSIAFQMFVDERLLPHELPYVRSRLADEHLHQVPAPGPAPAPAVPTAPPRR